MIIEIIDVGTPESVKTGKGQYQTLQVSFKNEQGQVTLLYLRIFRAMPKVIVSM
jgi:hypothetical protein